MKKHKMITLEQASACTLKQLVDDYNDAVEEIEFLEYRLRQLREDYDLLMDDYEVISNKLYG